MTDVGDTDSPTAAEIIARHQAAIWRYLRLLGCDPATADDLTQETFLALLRQESFQYTGPATTVMYLKRTAHNMYVSWLRKRKPTQALGDLEVCDTLWERWTSGDDDQALLLAALKSCFEQLSPRAQQALRLRFQEATSRNDIGAALGITEHGAKNLMQRAKQQLRQCVETKIQSKPPESNQPATG